MISAFYHTPRLGAILAFLGFGTALLQTVFLTTQPDMSGSVMLFDNFFKLGTIVCIISGIAVSLPAYQYLRTKSIGFSAEFFALVSSAVAAMIVMVAAGDLIIIFVNLEIVSIATYILCGINRDSDRSTESALKYFVNGAISSAVLLFGIAILYGMFGTTSIREISQHATLAQSPPTALLTLLGATCLLAGFLFKLGVVPFHAWMPDVYQGAPTIVTAFMATGVRMVTGLVLVRLFTAIFTPLSQSFNTIIIVAAVGSMIVGNFSALLQDNVKRMLGYSSVAHAGYLLLGFIGLSSNNTAYSEAAVYYLIIYAVASLGMFIAVGMIEEQNETKLDYNDFRGLGLRYPLLGIALSAFLFSLAGIPPFAGFFGKYAVFTVAVKNGFSGLAIFGAIMSLLSTYYYFRLVVNMFMMAPKEQSDTSVSLSPEAGIVIAICCFFTIWLAVGPSTIFGVIPSADGLITIISDAMKNMPGTH
jgi:NADH-quinone oxidoreductase subunit N